MSRIGDSSSDESFALDSPELLADPFPVYERLRQATPVLRTQLAYMGDQYVYLLSRYKDCVDLTTD